MCSAFEKSKDIRHFVERITPAAMLSRLEEIYEQRPDVRVVRSILEKKQGMLEWMHSVGVCTDKELSSLVPPFPPVELRRLTAAEELEIFLWTGLKDLEQIMTLYQRNRSAADPDRPTILDFGCGCGRMIRFLSHVADRYSVYGCDVNESLVSWCKESLTGIQVTQSNPSSPSPYQDRMFNLIYSLSIFTHLPEERASEWLSEMHRILASEGILIITTHGLSALETIRDSEVHQRMFGLERNQVINITTHLEQNSFVFLEYSRDCLQQVQAGDEYGSTFIHPRYIYENWDNEMFKLLQHLPGALRGWQDIVVLQRR